MEYTPGPWHIVRGDYNPSHGGMIGDVKVSSPYSTGRKHDYRRVGISAWDVHHKGQDPAFVSGEANARLIAASPDLLAAARMALSYIEDCMEPSCEEGEELDDGTVHDGSTPEGNALRAAIAKATGEPPSP